MQPYSRAKSNKKNSKSINIKFEGHKKSAKSEKMQRAKNSTSSIYGTGRGTRSSIYLNISLYTYHYLYMCPFYAVSSIVLSCIFHNTPLSNKALTSHHFLHQEHGMSHAHGHMYPSALSPRRINKVYYRPMPDAILVGFLTDMGIFSHPKSPHTKLQLLKLHTLPTSG